MSGLTSIIHPGMTEALAAQGFFPDTGDVYAEQSANVGGSVTKSWVVVAGLTDLPCAVAALKANEVPSSDGLLATSTHKALLMDPHVAIIPQQRFEVDSVKYEITGVETDSQTATTRLFLRRVLL